jgi:hypothetical protein
MEQVLERSGFAHMIVFDLAPEILVDRRRIVE